MNASTCVLITSTYPEKGEIFLRYEIPYLAAEFENVEIISTANRRPTIDPSEDLRRLQEFPNVKYIGDVSTLAPKIAVVPRLLWSTFFSDLPRATGSLVSFKKHVYRFIFASRLRQFLNNRYPDDGSAIFYSYWLNVGAVALAILSHKHNIRISRAHGSDVYDENIKTGYNTYTGLCARALDRIYCVSEHGQNYIVQKVGAPRKISVSRLGVPLAAPPNQPNKKKGMAVKLELVSCSTVDANKRVHLVAEALSYFDATPVRWTHIGDGPLLDEIKTAAEHLPENIETRFLGSMDNQEIHMHLKTGNFDIFLNTSLSEGVPVSVMEAMSYGIPCIATDVGGTRELVNDGGGKLVSADITASELAAAISVFRAALTVNSANKTAAARAKIAKDYSAKVNFTFFASNLENARKGILKES